MKLTAQDRRDVLRRWDRDRGKLWLRRLEIGAADAPAARRAGVCRSTLYNWRRRFLAGGTAALADGRASRGQENRSADPFIRHAIKLRFFGGLTIAECWRRASWRANAQGWEIRSYKATAANLRRIGQGALHRLERTPTGVRRTFKRG